MNLKKFFKGFAKAADAATENPVLQLLPGVAEVDRAKDALKNLGSPHHAEDLASAILIGAIQNEAQRPACRDIALKVFRAIKIAYPTDPDF